MMNNPNFFGPFYPSLEADHLPVHVAMQRRLIDGLTREKIPK
jgi:hypothetical protein